MNPYTTYFGGAAFTALTMAVHLALATTVTRTSALLNVVSSLAWVLFFGWWQRREEPKR